ncbi:MAG TPA: VOC family protein [Candidatus Sulfotelmatobacter sp.]|nr:VOC family protein [Candidatus Sulfotelmatobacter sp.]
MAQNPVGWFEIYVQDMARARKFYEGVFELKLQQLNAPNLEMWSFPMHRDQAGCAGALVKMDGVPSGGNSVVVYFTCADCAVEEARAEKRGGKIHKRKMSIGEYGYISLVCDPDGNMIGLHSMK